MFKNPRTTSYFDSTWNASLNIKSQELSPVSDMKIWWVGIKSELIITRVNYFESFLLRICMPCHAIR